MEKIILIILAGIYSVSFTPFTDKVELGGEEITSNQILSRFGPRKIYESNGKNFYSAAINTIILDIPGHYGSFIGLFNKNMGNEMILYSFSNHFPKPSKPTNAWTIGLFVGWSLRLAVLIFLILKIRKLSFNEQ